MLQLKFKFFRQPGPIVLAVTKGYLTLRFTSDKYFQNYG